MICAAYLNNMCFADAIIFVSLGNINVYAHKENKIRHKYARTDCQVTSPRSEENIAVYIDRPRKRKYLIEILTKKKEK